MLSHLKKKKIASFTIKKFSEINTLFDDSPSLHFTHFQFCMRCRSHLLPHHSPPMPMSCFASVSTITACVCTHMQLLCCKVTRILCKFYLTHLPLIYSFVFNFNHTSSNKYWLVIWSSIKYLMNCCKHRCSHRWLSKDFGCDFTLL